MKTLRLIDDKIIYKLNTSVPTDSFKHEIDAESRCRDLYKQASVIIIDNYAKYNGKELFTARFYNTLPSPVSFLDLIVSFLYRIVSFFRSHCFILEGGHSRIAPSGFICIAMFR